MKRILKWFFGLALLVVVLAVVLLLSLDTILRVVAENRIRAQTGMDAEIGKFHVGLLEPVVSIENLRLYNPPAFGGTPFLDIREIHVEYDRAALAKNQIHITLMRFNLGELDIVRNEAGQTNIFSLGVALSAKNAPGSNIGLKEFKQRTGLDFRGVDVLNVSVGTFKYIDLKDQRNNRTQVIGIENVPIRNVKSMANLAGLALPLTLHGGDFFTDVFGSDLNLW
jgi:uncharacterized protein involved in outer membrane biogenesis